MSEVTILSVSTPQITVTQPTVSTHLELSSSPGPQGPTGSQGPQGIQGNQGVQGVPGREFRAFLQGYNFTATPGVPTTQGKVAGNILPAPNTTIIYVGYEPTSLANVSVAPAILDIPSGLYLLLQDKTDETKWAKWLITGAPFAIPASRYAGIPVSFVSQSATGVNGQAVYLFTLRS